MKQNYHAATEPDMAVIPDANHYRYFLEKGREILREAGRGLSFAVLYADITGFQSLNALYGLAEGNRQLKEAESFLGRLTGIRLCRRLFSDHFLCLMQLPQAQMPEYTADFLQNSLQQFLRAQQVFHPDCPLHIACGLCQTEEASLNANIHLANIARKRCKSSNRSRVIWYDKKMAAQIAQEKQAAHFSQTALRENRFCFYLQPKVDLLTGQIIGAEALARGLDVNGQLVMPDSFIPILEQNGSIIEMDFLIFRKVCAYLQQLLQSRKPVVTISVNLSRLHTQQPHTAEALHQIAEEYGIPPYLLEFELTETLLLEKFDRAKHLVNMLRGYGYKVSIDDFGSGYAGINIWQELNFDVLKLDKRFLSEEPQLQVRNAALIPNLIEIANRLNLTVLCEGAETAEQCAYLQKLGCNIVQGYYFSKPLPCNAFDKLLEESQKLHTAPRIPLPRAPKMPDRLALESLFRLLPGAAVAFDRQTGQLLFSTAHYSSLLPAKMQPTLSHCLDFTDWLHLLLPVSQIRGQFLSKLEEQGHAQISIQVNGNGSRQALELYSGLATTSEEGAGEAVLCCLFLHGGESHR